MCVCACVCEERERERERQTDRQTDRQTQRHKDTKTDTDRQTDRLGARQMDRDRQRPRQTRTQAQLTNIDSILDQSHSCQIVLVPGSDSRPVSTSGKHWRADQGYYALCRDNSLLRVVLQHPLFPLILTMIIPPEKVCTL